MSPAPRESSNSAEASIKNAPEKTLMADIVSQKLSLKSPFLEGNTRKSVGNTQVKSQDRSRARDDDASC